MKDKQKVIEFANRVQKMMNEYHQKHFPMLPVPQISINWGRKYAKIVRANPQRSVYGFVNIETGEVLKAASWKAPAKWARGNINNPDKGMGCCGPYGIAYLR